VRAVSPETDSIRLGVHGQVFDLGPGEVKEIRSEHEPIHIDAPYPTV
jgi:hypothetical protein